MLRSMNSAVSGLRAHQNKLDVIGNNIANVNTFGYKSQVYSFKEAMYQTSSASTGGTATAGGSNAAQYGYGSMTGSIATDMSPSTATYMGGFNACIQGAGFFITSANKDAVANNSDTMKTTPLNYTRVGQFSVDSNGYIVDSQNNFILGFTEDNGTLDTAELDSLRAPSGVTVDNTGKVTATFDDTADPLEMTSVQINSLGEIMANVKYKDANGDDQSAVVSLGKVAIASFPNPEGLTKVGGNNFQTSPSDNSGDVVASIPGSAGTPTLMTGYIEASNVDLAREFSEMITAQRGFQANSKVITVSDEILSELMNMKR